MYLMLLNCTLKMVKVVNFMLCVFYHNLKKQKIKDGFTQRQGCGLFDPAFPQSKESTRAHSPRARRAFYSQTAMRRGFLRYLMIDFKILIERPDNLYSESACPAIN